MPATRTPPAGRTLTVLSATRDGRPAVVTITARGKRADYAFTRVNGAWLVGPAELPDAAAYAVTDGGVCTCPAGRHGKPCEHVAAVAKLVELRVLAAK
jgi:hypothetical protein